MKMTIGVMGASGGDLPEQVKQRAYRLGEAIAARDAVLITGGCPGLPYEAVRGAKAKGARRQGQTREDHAMKKTIATAAGLAVLFAASVALAQMRPMTPSQGQPPAGTHAPGQPSQQQPMMGQGQMGQGMSGMMCPMMGQSMMGMGMGSGMMGGMMGTSDPKSQARMLKLRGDMMKAMGEVMLKHAQEIEQAK